MAINSDPNTKFSTLASLLENHCTGALFKKMKNPVLDLIITPSPAHSPCPRIVLECVTSNPSGIGTAGGG